MIEIVKTILENEIFEKEEGSIGSDDELLHYSFHRRESLGVILIDVPIESIGIINSFLENYQMSLFDSIKENSNLYNIDLKKNIYLIFIVNKDETNYLKRKSIVEIEEDSYYFKKFVLQYNSEELEYISSLLEPVNNYRDKLVELGSNNTFFQNFADTTKVNHNSIVYDLLIKLPFINVSIDTRGLHNLETTIRESLGDKNLLELTSSVLECSESISEMDDKKIDQWIKDKYEIQNK